MKFVAYLLWTISGPMFAGGVVWAIAAAIVPLWAIALGMFIHMAIWGSVQNWMHENKWD